MKNLEFNRLALISNKEKRARVVNFHPNLTVVTGENDTGKSVLIKSIYHTMGADVLFEPNWQEADVAGLLDFSFGGGKYRILRYAKTFALFDDKNKLLWRGRGIHKSLRPKLSEFFDFQLQLKRGTERQYEVATPAFMYLPFYIDQDRGWTMTWASFENLAQYSKWKDDLIKYHTGIRPKEYYKLKQKIGDTEAELAVIENQLDLLSDARGQLEKNRDPYVFDTDVESFQIEINKLLAESQNLYTKEKSYKRLIDKLKSDEIVITAQITILQNTIKESNADFEFATNLKAENVECPTCGTEFHNDFVNRFSIAEDLSIAFSTLEELREKLKVIREELDVQMKAFLKNKDESIRVRKILGEKKGDLTFKDVISSESHKEVRAIFEGRIDEINKRKASLQSYLDDINKQLSEFFDKKRIQEINAWYNDQMQSGLLSVHVHDLPTKDYENLKANIHKTGSDLPRALLVYYYSVLSTICKYGTGAVMPAVVDSPNQQDQDYVNLKSILEYSINKSPANLQLVLGTVEMHGVALPKDSVLVNLNEKGHLLSESAYLEVQQEVEPLLTQAMIE